MPNGHDKNWIRLCAAIDGFRHRFGRWPTRVRMLEPCLTDLRDMFTAQDFEIISKNLKLIADEGSMIAEDDTGASYNYGQEGFPNEHPSPSAEQWLGVQPKPEE
jgi:hypothetical protein